MFLSVVTFFLVKNLSADRQEVTNPDGDRETRKSDPISAHGPGRPGGLSFPSRGLTRCFVQIKAKEPQRGVLVVATGIPLGSGAS